MRVQQLYHGCAAIVPWVCSNCAMGVQQLYHVCAAVVPWVCSNCAMGVQQLCHGCAAIVPWVCSNFAMGVQQLYHGCAAIVPWECSNCAMGVQQLYHGCAATVPWVCSNCAMGVPRVYLCLVVVRDCTQIPDSPKSRVGQNRILTLYMTVYLVISLPKNTVYRRHCIRMVWANPTEQSSMFISACKEPSPRILEK